MRPKESKIDHYSEERPQRDDGGGILVGVPGYTRSLTARAQHDPIYQYHCWALARRWWKTPK